MGYYTNHPLADRVYTHIAAQQPASLQYLATSTLIDRGKLAKILSQLERDYRVRRVNQGRTAYWEIVEPLPVEEPPRRISQDDVFACIRNHPGLTISGIAKEMGMKKNAVKYHIDNMANSMRIGYELDLSRSNDIYKPAHLWYTSDYAGIVFRSKARRAKDNE